MDNEVESTGSCLLLRIAQATVNSFVKQQVNLALADLVHNCSPGRVLTVLLKIGVGHVSPPVRASTAQQLQLMADQMGAEAILTTGQSFTSRFLTAVSKLSVDAAVEVRSRGQATIQLLAKHQDFMKLWLQSVPEKDRRFVKRIVMNACGM
ncbi:TOG array regulator of axonemal microtubules protein 2-like [Menidia menidia]